MIRPFTKDGVTIWIPHNWRSFIYAGRKYQIVYGVIVDVGVVKILTVDTEGATGSE